MLDTQEMDTNTMSPYLSTMSALGKQFDPLRLVGGAVDPQALFDRDHRIAVRDENRSCLAVKVRGAFSTSAATGQEISIAESICKRRLRLGMVPAFGWQAFLQLPNKRNERRLLVALSLAATIFADDDRQFSRLEDFRQSTNPRRPCIALSEGGRRSVIQLPD